MNHVYVSHHTKFTLLINVKEQHGAYVLRTVHDMELLQLADRMQKRSAQTACLLRFVCTAGTCHHRQLHHSRDALEWRTMVEQQKKKKKKVKSLC